MNLVAKLLQDSSTATTAAALSFRGQSISPEQLFEHVLTVGTGLTSRGVEPGDRVALCLSNGPAFVVGYLATLSTGAVAVPLSTMMRPREAREQCDDCRPRLILAEGRGARALKEVASVAGIELVEPGIGTLPFMQLRGRTLRRPLDRRPEDPAALHYTAAYGGFSRAAILTHGSLLANAGACVEAWNVTAGDRIAAFLPLFHSFGLMTTLLAPMLVGAESVLLDRFSPAGAVAAVQARKVTIFPGVPTMFWQLLGEGLLSRTHLSSVRNFTCGGAALSDELRLAAERNGEVLLLQGYGLTENSPVVSVNRDRENEKIGSVGTPLPTVEVVVEKDGVRVSRGVEGEILIGGPSVMKGYYEDGELTRRFLKDGWLHTRDLGHVDEDGYIYLTGRKLPLFITGGFNIYPAEVERVLLEHPEVSSVEFSAIEDQVHGELLAADVRVRPGSALTADELSSWCRRELAAYKIPRKLSIHLPEKS